MIRTPRSEYHEMSLIVAARYPESKKHQVYARALEALSKDDTFGAVGMVDEYDARVRGIPIILGDTPENQMNFNTPIGMAYLEFMLDRCLHIDLQTSQDWAEAAHSRIRRVLDIDRD